MSHPDDKGSKAQQEEEDPLLMSPLIRIMVGQPQPRPPSRSQRQMPKATTEKATANASGKDNEAEGKPGRGCARGDQTGTSRGTRTVFSKFGWGVSGSRGEVGVLVQAEGKVCVFGAGAERVRERRECRGGAPTAEIFCEFEDMARVLVLVDEADESGAVEEQDVTQKEHDTMVAESATELEGKAHSAKSFVRRKVWTMLSQYNTTQDGIGYQRL
ncbi:hypothetical protein BJ742DRAFT_765433 [Cladochytrium replicatum]|nr:hypothetical protein BJ742DRAFT_765433 [Cladochytrium replicatum]